MRILTRSDVLAAIVLLALATSTVAAEDQAPPPEAKPIPRAEPVAPAEAPAAKAKPAPKTVPSLAPKADPSLAPKAASSPGAAVPLSVTLQLNVGNAELRGALLSAPQFTMKTSFGELIIPMSQVAGVKLASEGNTSTTVVMHNGDAVTGVWDLDQLELQTEWGTATVDGTAINSILFAPDLAWVSEKGLSGTRWGLLAKPKAGQSGPPAEGLEPGDIIVVTRESDLKTGTEVVGQVAQDEVLAIEGVLEGYLYVNTGKVAGWIPRENVSPYKPPEADGAKSESGNVAERARTRSR